MSEQKGLEKEKIEAISRNIKRWQNIPQIVDFCDQKIEAKPKFISVQYIERDIVSTSIDEGGIIDKNALTNDTGISVKGLIGTETQGFSIGFSSMENFSRNIDQIYRAMNVCLDLTVKYALRGYLRQISDGIILKNGKDYTRLSVEEVSSIQEPVKHYNRLEKSELRKLTNFSKALLRHRYITTTSIDAVNVLNRNFFVDSEDRKIFSTNYREMLSIGVGFDHESGAKKAYASNFLNPNYKNIDDLLDNVFAEILTYVNQESTAPAIKSGQYAVIFGPGASGTTFHEGLGGHLLSGEYICTGLSTAFRDKIGEKIMPLDITIIDNPLDASANGYYTYDDEGVPAKRTVLVENGILKNYLLNRNAAAHFGISSNGHARSEWVNGISDDGEYRPVLPEPRTSNMEIYSPKGVSDKKLEQIMRNYCKKEGQEYGLYIDAGAGGVNVGTSEFLIYPHSIWKIYTNGRRERATDGVIVGNAYELLKQIAAIGNQPKITLGTCGSSSGGVPVQESAPAIFLPRVTVTAIDQERYTKRLLESEK